MPPEDCYEAALRLLSYRPRSEAELRQRLQRRYPAEAVAETMRRLREQGLVDDEAFARFWVENRQQFRPRGARLLRAELREKGMAPETIAAALEGLEEREAARRAASKRTGALRGLEEQAFRRRLGDFLRRRGFAYETSAAVVQELWQAQEQAL